MRFFSVYCFLLQQNKENNVSTVRTIDENANSFYWTIWTYAMTKWTESRKKIY